MGPGTTGGRDTPGAIRRRTRHRSTRDGRVGLRVAWRVPLLAAEDPVTTAAHPRNWPTCTTCGFEALRLIKVGRRTYCDWDVPYPHLGRPFDPARWVTVTEALAERVREVTAA